MILNNVFKHCYLLVPHKSAYSRIFLTGGLSALVLILLMLHREYPQHQFMVFLFPGLSIYCKPQVKTLHKETQWNYSPQGNSSSLRKQTPRKKLWEAELWKPFTWLGSAGRSCSKACMLKTYLSSVTDKSKEDTGELSWPIFFQLLALCHFLGGPPLLPQWARSEGFVLWPALVMANMSQSLG